MLSGKSSHFSHNNDDDVEHGLTSDREAGILAHGGVEGRSSRKPCVDQVAGAVISPALLGDALIEAAACRQGQPRVPSGGPPHGRQTRTDGATNLVQRRWSAQLGRKRYLCPSRKAANSAAVRRPCSRPAIAAGALHSGSRGLGPNAAIDASSAKIPMAGPARWCASSSARLRPNGDTPGEAVGANIT